MLAANQPEPGKLIGAPEGEARTLRDAYTMHHRQTSITFSSAALATLAFASSIACRASSSVIFTS